MQWFYVQRLADAPGGGTSTQYLGPFYGDPSAMKPLMVYGYHLMIYVNGVWASL